MKIKKLLFALCLLAAAISAMNFVFQNVQPSLRDVFRNSFLIGAALNDNLVSGKDPDAASIVEKHCNTITAENVMKWIRIHPLPDVYDFDAADRFVEYGQNNKMVIVGHTLIWHHQIPGWAFVDSTGKQLGRDAMLARMKEHIFSVVGRYKGKVKGWDVVNEALDDNGTLRKTKWIEIIGKDFVAKAFEYAHEADPNAELYYNDFLIDRPEKRDGTMQLVRELQSKGLRIDGIGIQWHCGLDYPVSAEFDAFVDSISTLGLKIMITELDVDVLPNALQQYGTADIDLKAETQKNLNPYITGLPEEIQQKLADRYAEIFSMILKHSRDISRVTFWGVYDKTSWLNNWPVRGRTNYPLLFDRNYQPKPAFFSVIKTAADNK